MPIKTQFSLFHQPRRIALHPNNLQQSIRTYAEGNAQRRIMIKIMDEHNPDFSATNQAVCGVIRQRFLRSSYIICEIRAFRKHAVIDTIQERTKAPYQVLARVSSDRMVLNEATEHVQVLSSSQLQ
jgi:hypothetical protein